MAAAIVAEGLVKTYGSGERAVRALDGVDLEVPEGTVLGLLGPNGAGKTTAVRVLTTLLTPDSGQASVLGIDVRREPQRVRERIGLSGQYAAVDENLTGRENLVMVGRLYHLGKATASARAQDLLDQFDLSDAADRTAKTYSGGMRRRLDLAAALVVRPPVMFLDEPTTGLDPRTRIAMWDVIANLVESGATLLLTTQYLEEADRLADSIAVVDHGRVIARGTADELKTQVGGERLQLVVHERDRLGDAAGILTALALAPPSVDERSRELIAPVSGGAKLLVEAVRLLDDAGITVDDLALRRPTLDDVFLTLTGKSAEEAQAAQAAQAAREGTGAGDGAGTTGGGRG
ncbi:ATP-binding cassette domain-containing protein [Actinospica durhamensis]|uniref:ATP-binding cassette domain-containing protein n=1 Tax=Actinospica durhamensis TaxID=1508375 RepID=A0A941ETT9_9ACTN|nr:ATP-binding cassette domain-containing protein [Actinospica durhamensis]MBR7837181.1 ATP-binding cassette domain-containing protein [Actinospica durhamensis]